MNIAQMLATGPTIKTIESKSNCNHFIESNRKRKAEQEKKLIDTIKGRKMTTPEVATALGYKSNNGGYRILKKMEKRGLVRQSGRTVATQAMQSKIIWELVTN